MNNIVELYQLPVPTGNIEGIKIDLTELEPEDYKILTEEVGVICCALYSN